jgi:acetyl-CoA carboxylase biotin carboxyl carrier protein
MRKEEIQELIKLVEESGINELEVTQGRNRIRISKGAASVPANPAQFVTAPAAGAAAPAPGTAGSTPDAGDAEEKLASNLKQITSPMVGTFYRAPAPGSDPFVDVGETVSVGQTVCIVEAMKLMNEIGSDYNGVVRQILIDNAQPVEYGQPLFLVEVK